MAHASRKVQRCGQRCVGLAAGQVSAPGCAAVPAEVLTRAIAAAGLNACQRQPCLSACKRGLSGAASAASCTNDTPAASPPIGRGGPRTAGSPQGTLAQAPHHPHLPPLPACLLPRPPPRHRCCLFPAGATADAGASRATCVAAPHARPVALAPAACLGCWRSTGRPARCALPALPHSWRTAGRYM
jgi:hypothetical protein